MPELELHQLQRPYQELRISTAAKSRRLLSSLAADGQRTPVLVVETEADSYVLIDGYQRVAALEKLGIDTVDAVVLPLDEASALVLWHSQQSTARRSMLEEAWLLRTLNEQHGLNQPELASRLGHTTSWVSRRLGLLRALPDSVQELLRQGQLSSYPAMRYLVVLARANSSDCAKLAANLAGHQISTRQMERLYVAWRSMSAEGRTRLVDQPLLFLRAAQEMQRSEPPQADTALVSDMKMLEAVSRRVTSCLSKTKRELPEELDHIWVGIRASLEELIAMMKERRKNDRQRLSQGDPAATTREGNGQTTDRQGAGDLA